MKPKVAVRVARVLQAAIWTGAAYILTYTTVVHILAQPSKGLDWSMTTPLAISLTVVPYLVGGLYCRYTSRGMPRLYPLWTALLAVLVERSFIFGVGYWFFARGGDGSMEGISLLMFIRGEAAPHFAWPYILLGAIGSVAIMCAVALVGRGRGASQTRLPT